MKPYTIERLDVPMSRHLGDGERRVMKPAPWLGTEEARKVRVTAVRIDSETPYVLLGIGESEVWCSDVLANDIIERLRRALSILPTSK